MFLDRLHPSERSSVLQISQIYIHVNLDDISFGMDRTRELSASPIAIADRRTCVWRGKNKQLVHIVLVRIPLYIRPGYQPAHAVANQIDIRRASLLLRPLDNRHKKLLGGKADRLAPIIKGNKQLLVQTVSHIFQHTNKRFICSSRKSKAPVSGSRNNLIVHRPKQPRNKHNRHLLRKKQTHAVIPLPKKWLCLCLFLISLGGSNDLIFVEMNRIDSILLPFRRNKAI